LQQSHLGGARQGGAGLLENLGELRQNLRQQQDDRAYAGNEQDGRVNRRGDDARCLIQKKSALGISILNTT